MAYKDSMNRFRTQSLFIEFNPIDPKGNPDLQPVFALTSGKELPWLKDLYMACEDLLEYRFAIQAFDSWEQWQRIKANKSIQPYLEGWHQELELKVRSEGIRVIMNEALGSGKSKFAAAKYLANGDYKKLYGRGRPTKAEVEQERKVQARLADEFDDDASRIGLKVVDGGQS